MSDCSSLFVSLLYCCLRLLQDTFFLLQSLSLCPLLFIQQALVNRAKGTQDLLFVSFKFTRRFCTNLRDDKIMHRHSSILCLLLASFFTRCGLTPKWSENQPDKEFLVFAVHIFIYLKVSGSPTAQMDGNL